MCKECGYQACGSCESHHSRGAFLSASVLEAWSLPYLIPIRPPMGHIHQGGRKLPRGQWQPSYPLLLKMSHDMHLLSIMLTISFFRRRSIVLDVCIPHTGTCYCPNSNFGKSYCRMEPRWYHTNGRGRAYAGDRHPDSLGRPYPDEMYDPTPRACDCCGTVTKVFKKDYRDPWVWH